MTKTYETLRERIRSALQRTAAPPAPEEPSVRLFDPPAHTCLVCKSRPEVELMPDLIVHQTELGRVPTRRAYLCWDDLVPFLTTFADPRVATWRITPLR